MASARREHDADVAVRGLGAEGGAEDAEEVEVGEVVYAPAWFQAVEGGDRRREARGLGGGAEDDHVEATWGGVVDPFRGEEADGVEGGEVDLLGVD